MKARRRRFLTGLASLPLWSAAGSAPAAPQAPPAGATGAAHDEVVQALGQVLRARYGSYLEAGEFEALIKVVTEARRAAERLHTRALDPSQEPATVFHARPPRPAAAVARAPRRGRR